MYNKDAIERHTFRLKIIMVLLFCCKFAIARLVLNVFVTYLDVGYAWDKIMNEFMNLLMWSKK